MLQNDFETALQEQAELLLPNFSPLEKVTVKVEEHENMEPNVQAYYEPDGKGTGTIYASPGLEKYGSRGIEATLKHELTHQWLDKQGMIEEINHHSSAFWQKYAIVGVPEYIFMHDLVVEIKRRVGKYLVNGRNKENVEIAKKLNEILESDNDLLCMLVFNSLREIDDFPKSEWERVRFKGSAKNNV